MALEWTEELSTGVLEIDAQHKELLGRLKTLRDACREGRGKELIDEMMYFIGNYVNVHFGLEEMYMKQFNYPQMDFHVKEHREFTRRYLELREELQKTGWRLYATLEMNELLGQWWIAHISKIDKALGRYLKDQLRSFKD